jgi:formate-dependent nitrite reductase membrane component NrfD
VTNGGITAVGTEMRSYYGRPILKEPVWKPQIPAYFFTGGMAGGCSLLHGFARVARQERVATTALYVGASADAVSAVLLVADLGRPERFLNMFRVFKVTSPMSVGSWVLLVSTAASSTAAVLELLGILKPLRRGATAVAFASGGPLTTYTGTLIADTAIPVWHEARRELPWLFGAGGCASAGAATALFLPPVAAGPARRLALLGAVSELAWMEVMQHRLGFVGEVYKQGQAGRLARLSKVLTVAGAGVLASTGRRSRAAAIGGGTLLLAGGLALRWSVFRAGFQSAADPRYTVIPQRQRLERRS